MEAERPLRSAADLFAREKGRSACYGCFALVTVATGVLGLIATSWLKQVLGLWIHAVFALQLCCLVFARWQWCVRLHNPSLPLDSRETSRHLSRIVYLSLYFVIGVRELIGIINSFWHGGSVDFNLFDPRFRHGPDSEAFDPKDDFQLFLASGLFALIFIRMLAFKVWSYRVLRNTPVDAAKEICLVSADCVPTTVDR